MTVSALAALLWCAAAGAAVLFEETFDYAVGNLSNVSGGAWYSLSPTADNQEWRVEHIGPNGSLTYVKNGHELPTSGKCGVSFVTNNGTVNYTQQLGAMYSNGTVWVGALLSCPANWYLNRISLYDGTTLRAFFGVRNESPNVLRFHSAAFPYLWPQDYKGAGDFVNGTNTTISGIAPTNDARWIVMCFDFANSNVMAYVDPDPADTNPADNCAWQIAIMSTGLMGNARFSSVRLERSNSGQRTYIDEFRITTSWNELRGIPEPSLLVGLVLAGIVVRRWHT